MKTSVLFFLLGFCTTYTMQKLEVPKNFEKQDEQEEPILNSDEDDDELQVPTPPEVVVPLRQSVNRQSVHDNTLWGQVNKITDPVFKALAWIPRRLTAHVVDIRPAVPLLLDALADAFDPDLPAIDNPAAERLITNMSKLASYQMRPKISQMVDGQEVTLQEAGAARKIIDAQIEMWAEYLAREGKIEEIAQALGAIVERQMAEGKPIGKALLKVRDYVKEVGKEVNAQAEELSNKYRGNLKYTALAVGGMGGGWYGSRFMWNKIERHLFRPQLISKSSYEKGLFEYLWPTPRKPRPRVFTKQVQEDFDDLVAITKSVSAKVAAGEKNVEYVNVLLFGPPGTGKTLFAEELAYESGMDFVQMSGASFAKFTNNVSDGIDAIDKLFEWAKKAPRGLIIFIDEADAFLADRDNVGINSPHYQLVTHFLNKTGTGSNTYMLMVSSNKLKVFDTAINRRFPRKIYVGLPDKERRKRILYDYRKNLLLDEKQKPEFIASANTYLSDERIQQLAEKLEGFAPSELKDIINAIKVNAGISESGLVSEAIINRVEQQALHEHVLLAAPAA